MPEENVAVVFNVQQTGYYRVNYDKKNWKLIAKQLLKDHQTIHVINRAQIMDDALNLAKSDMLDYETALSTTGYLSNELEYIPWASALTGLSYINRMLKRTPAYGAFKKYMLKIIDPIYTKLGFNAKPEDSHLDILLRKKAVSWACSMGNKDCLDKAQENFSNWMGMVEPDMAEANPVDVNLKYETYCNAISDGSDEEWDFAWQRYKGSHVASEKSTILSALGCTKEVWLLNRYLNMSLTPGSGVRRQDGSTVIGGVSRNTVGRYLAFDFIRDQWNTVKEVFTGFTQKNIGRAIKYIASSFSTQFEIEQLREFADEHASELGTSTRAVQQAIEAAEANLMWMEKNYEKIWRWLEVQNSRLY